MRLWSELLPERRAQAFTPRSYAQRLEQIRRLDVGEELREALEAAAEALRGGPEQAASIADACSRICRWAENHGPTGTALEFAQAAALVERRDAARALEVARMAADRDETARAESWYRQAIFTARQTRDWNSFASAFLGQGRLYERRGDTTAARTSFLRALRIARRHSLGQIAAAACHRILEIAILQRRAPEIDRYARATLQASRNDHEGLVRLARTLALYLVDRGFYGEGKRLLALLPLDAGEAADRLELHAARAEAAAALGDDEGYQEAVDAVRALIASGGDGGGAPASWIALLRAAAWMADGAAAEELESHARRAAQAVHDESAVKEIAWLADPAAAPPDLELRRASPALRGLVADIEQAVERSARTG